MRNKVLVLLVMIFLGMYGVISAQNTGVYLDGVNDYVSLGTNKVNTDMNGATGITVSAWINPYSLRTGSDANRNLLFDLPIQATNSMVSMYLREGGKIRFGGRSTNGDTFMDYVTANAVITTNTWQYVTGVLDFANDQVLLYVDAVLIGSVSKNFASNTYVPGTGGNEVFGASASLGAKNMYFHGMIDEIKVWNTPLTLAQIEYQMYRSYTSNLPAGLIGYWNFQEDSGTIAHDISNNANDGTLMNGAGWGSSVTLPVELSTFTVTITSELDVRLRWITESESEMSGYYVLRNDSKNLASAFVVSPLMEAVNSSGQSHYEYLDDEVSFGTWYYWLQGIGLNGEEVYYGPITATVSQYGEQTPPPVDRESYIRNVFPNPFSTSITADISIAKRSDVKLDVFNIRGQIVRAYHPGPVNPGSMFYTWDGKDDSGVVCPAGVYFIRLQTEERTTFKKVQFIK